MAGNTRVVVCGMGNVLYGDDGVGPAFVREAAGVGRHGGGAVALMDCGASPGAKISEIASLSPSVVIVVSAADMGRSAGAVRLLSFGEAREALQSAHKVDRAMFLTYLQGTLPAGTKFFFVGVQPGESSQGRMLGPAGRGALVLVRRLLDELLEEHGARL